MRMKIALTECTVGVGGITMKGVLEPLAAMISTPSAVAVFLAFDCAGLFELVLIESKALTL